MATNQQRGSERLAALDALGKISILAEAALRLTANATERDAQNELIGIINDIASTTKKKEEA